MMGVSPMIDGCFLKSYILKTKVASGIWDVEEGFNPGGVANSMVRAPWGPVSHDQTK